MGSEGKFTSITDALHSLALLRAANDQGTTTQDELATVAHSVDPIAALGSTGQDINAKSLPHGYAASQSIDVDEGRHGSSFPLRSARVATSAIPDS
jgi:hypothetical protein